MLLDLATILDRLNATIQNEYAATETLDRAVGSMEVAIDSIGEAQTCLLQRSIDSTLDASVRVLDHAHKIAKRAVNLAYARIQWLEDQSAQIERMVAP